MKNLMLLDKKMMKHALRCGEFKSQKPAGERDADHWHAESVGNMKEAKMKHGAFAAAHCKGRISPVKGKMKGR